MDLRDCDNAGKLPSGAPCKNSSGMWDTYNTYSNGHGGCCAAWAGDHSPYGPMGNYFCGNSSAGGWVGYNDPRPNNTVGLSAQLPYGFDYNATDANHQGPFLSSLKDPGKSQYCNLPTRTFHMIPLVRLFPLIKGNMVHHGANTVIGPCVYHNMYPPRPGVAVAGAIMHVFRSQGWFVNMFEIASNDAATGSVEFKTWTDKDGYKHPVGGWQGGTATCCILPQLCI